MRVLSRNPDETQRFARALAAAIDAAGLVVGLVGPLGAGKTVFAKGLAAGLGIDPATVASPTFVIASEYSTPAGGRLAHVDFYRVDSAAELEATGFADLLGPGSVVVVEWAERFSAALPRDHLKILIERRGADAGAAGRTLHALSSGPISERVLGRWRAALGASPMGSDRVRE